MAAAVLATRNPHSSHLGAGQRKTPHSPHLAAGKIRTPMEAGRRGGRVTRDKIRETNMAATIITDQTAPKVVIISQAEVKAPRLRVRAVDQKESPLQARKSANEKYEKPKSDREGWWRRDIRETPNPGTYESRTFLEEQITHQKSCSFLSDGRRLDPQPQIGRGMMLLPGAYHHEDFLKRFDKSTATYSFKGTSRADLSKKVSKLCPTTYDIEKYGALSGEKHPSRHWQFRSQCDRFPTIYFRPKEGPAPGAYEYTSPPPEVIIRSAFLSKTPRFASSHTKVPGPGYYEKTVQAPMPKTILKMGRDNGIFFSSGFQT